MENDISRVGGTHKKKSKSLMAFYVEPECVELIGTDTNLLIGYLPPHATIVNAYVFGEEAGTANVTTVGTTEGGTEILSAGDLGAAGVTGTFTGVSGTGSGVPVYVGLAAAVSDQVAAVVIEYDEYLLNNGDLTQIKNAIA